MCRAVTLCTVFAIAWFCVAPRSVVGAADGSPDVGRLIAAVCEISPLEDDLRTLSDRIGGRATGSEANRRAIDWALERFRSAGLDARTEAFTMPSRWLERSASATVSGQNVSFSPQVAAMPYSTGTSPEGATARLIDLGRADAEDFKKIGDAARGAFILVETDELRDVDGLFREYTDSALIEQRAFAAGVGGVVYMGSRAAGLLYRHNVSTGAANTRPMAVMEREGARRTLRLLRTGVPLTLTLRLDIDSSGAYETNNVIAEIQGASRPDEIVLMGAHLDSWDLGGGALDNGANVAMMIDIGRQIRRLGLRPARTIRLALWNGEEQGIYGSLGYAKAHEAELDRHVVAGSIDLGCGRITGFFTGGRPDLVETVDRLLAPVAGLGPFAQVDAPVVGTDNFDFMLEGVANLVANQETALYGPNYHARSDEFDKCDTRQLRLNEIVVAALVYGFAQDDLLLKRQSRSEIEAMMKRTDLANQMKAFGLWEAWANGQRGRKP
jgi:hypothetical protein